VVGWFHGWLQARYKKPNTKPDPIPGWLTGVVERLLFTLVVGLEVGAAAPAMMAWIAAKMLAHWSRTLPSDIPKEERAEHILGAFAALLASAASMIFALIGGLIAAGEIWPS
jgi:hypothetical protein